MIDFVSHHGICSDEVVILSASGSAVTLHVGEKEPVCTPSTIPEKEPVSKRDSDPGSTVLMATPVNKAAKVESRPTPTLISHDHPHFHCHLQTLTCSLCHIPYSDLSVPFPMSLIKCAICKKARVPDILFMTIEPPPNMPITGTGCLIQARVCRSKRDSKGEQCAKEISDVSL